jgi:pyruvate kinase
LALSWGVLPVLIKEIDSIEELLNYAPQHLKELGWIKSDQIMVITAGVPVGHPGTTNMIKVVEVE